MANQNLLTTRTTSFGELLGNGRRYRVPPFQRDYAWNEENWDDLWQDILTVYETQTPHFMGTIVTQFEQPTTESEIFTIEGKSLGIRPNISIIDGQQRLATLSILAISVIQKIKDLAEQGIEPEANRDRQEILRRTYLGDRDAGSLRYASKLLLNENNNGFYQDNLINLRPPRNIYKLTKSERLLWQAFEYFLSQLEAQSEIANKGALLAHLLTSIVAQKLVFIQISVEDETSAYVLFETLNSRGIELGATDLLKNYLFSILRSPDDFYAAQRQWTEITRTVGMEQFPQFLKCFLSMTKRRVRQNRLLKLIKENIRSPEEAFELLDRLSEVSELYAALNDPNDDFWLAHPNSRVVRELVRSLNIFNSKQAYPALFAAYQTFNHGKFEKFLNLVVTIAFRHSVVSDLNPNELEIQYSALAVDISTGKIKSPKAAFDAIASVYVKDDKFKQDFSLLAVSSKQNKGLIKYILRYLEKATSGRDITEDSFSIEHILPQNPDELWRESFGEEKLADTFSDRIGNLTPLERDLNSSLGRASYPVKRETYAKSAYAMTNNIQAEEWTADAIVHRQERLAELAAQIWRVNY